MNFVYKTNAFVIFLVSVKSSLQIMLTDPIKTQIVVQVNSDTFKRPNGDMYLLRT